jgi:high mobility group protein B1
MAKLADLWKNLKEGDKKRYQDIAEREKVKYLTELNEYYLVNPLDVIQNKTKKNHIKKPCSAYGLFLKDAKDVIKSDKPDLKMADVLKVVAEQ